MEHLRPKCSETSLILNSTMNKADETRWLRQLESFGKVLSKLDKLCETGSRTKIELLALVKAFELSLDLGCEALKNLLIYEGCDLSCPRDTIRTGFQANHLSENDAEIFLKSFDVRENLGYLLDERTVREAEAFIEQKCHPMLRRLHVSLADRAEQWASGSYQVSHWDRTQRAVLKDRYREAIIEKISSNNRVERAVLFGSRATETNTPTSDVDIVLFGSDLTSDDQTRLNFDVEDLTIPQKVDLVLHDGIKNPTLLEHIRTEGVNWYLRPSREIIAGQGWAKDSGH